MVGWHHPFNGHEFEQAPGDDGQGSLASCSPWAHKESERTERLNNNKCARIYICVCVYMCMYVYIYIIYNYFPSVSSHTRRGSGNHKRVYEKILPRSSRCANEVHRREGLRLGI